MCILDLSKVLMYKFHYDRVKNQYSNNLTLLFMYTDILMYKIKTEDLYKELSKDKKIFYFSNSSAKLKYFDDSNKLMVRKMKDETAGAAI